MDTSERFAEQLRHSAHDDQAALAESRSFGRHVRRALVVLLVGLTLTTLAVTDFRRREDSTDVAEAEETAEFLFDQAAQLLGRAIEGADTLADINESAWPDRAGYQTLWATFGSAFGSDSVSALSIQVEPDALADLVASEQATDPSFNIRFKNPSPTADHIITMRVGSLDGVHGTDASSFPGIHKTYSELAVGDTSLAAFDLRDPVEEDDGQLQILHAHMTQPSFLGEPVRAWTTVQVDTRSLIRPILVDITDGAVVRLIVAGEEVVQEQVGSTPLGDSVESVQRVGETGDLSIEVSVPLTTLPAMERTSTGWGLAGLGLSVAAALLTLLVGRVRAIQNQARTSAIEARVDELTGIPNRRWMMERLSSEDSDNCAVLFCDLDHFSNVNDMWGHEAGDELLRETATRLKNTVGESADVARFGGDEFVVVISEVGDPMQAAQEAAERIAHSLSEPFVLDGRPHRIDASIGIATSTPELPQSFAELTSSADVALAQCKRMSRGSWSVYDEALRKAETDRLELEADLDEALDSGAGFVVHYQAIVGLDGETTSYEALVRFRRNGEVLLPGRFLDAITDMGRMGDLGRLVFRQAFADYSAASDVAARCTLQVNTDASLLADPEFPAFVDALLIEFSIDAKQLILEIVEDAWEVDQASVERNLQFLAARGLKFAIDDFGVGHSSLGRIIQVPNVTAIKLDRSLTMLLHNPRHEGFTSGINHIATTLGCYLVAEGVETVNDRDAAVRVGITRFQGFLWDVPAEGFELHPLERTTASGALDSRSIEADSPAPPKQTATTAESVPHRKPRR